MALVFWIQKLKGRFGGCWNCCFCVFISWYGDVWIITNQSASLKLQVTSWVLRLLLEQCGCHESTPWFQPSKLWSWGFDFTVESASVRLGCRVGKLRNVVGNHMTFVNDIFLDPTWGIFSFVSYFCFAWPRTNQEFHEDTTENTWTYHIFAFTTVPFVPFFADIQGSQGHEIDRIGASKTFLGRSHWDGGHLQDGCGVKNDAAYASWQSRPPPAPWSTLSYT